eukprot:1975511-Prymnesium_polylepis.2
MLKWYSQSTGFVHISHHVTRATVVSVVRASLSETDRRAHEFDRAMQLIQDGQLSRAMRVLHTSGVARLTEGPCMGPTTLYNLNSA